jgi:hypothetical protein
MKECRVCGYKTHDDWKEFGSDYTDDEGCECGRTLTSCPNCNIVYNID